MIGKSTESLSSNFSDTMANVIPPLSVINVLSNDIDLKYLKKLNKLFTDRSIKMPEINENQAIVLSNTDLIGVPITLY